MRSELCFRRSSLVAVWRMAYRRVKQGSDASGELLQDSQQEVMAAGAVGEQECSGCVQNPGVNLQDSKPTWIHGGKGKRGIVLSHPLDGGPKKNREGGKNCDSSLGSEIYYLIDYSHPP